MKTNAVRFSSGLLCLAISMPFPAHGQFIYPPVLIVPPPAQDNDVRNPKPPPDKPKAVDTQAQTGGHYEGRRWVPD